MIHAQQSPGDKASRPAICDALASKSVAAPFLVGSDLRRLIQHAHATLIGERHLAFRNCANTPRNSVWATLKAELCGVAYEGTLRHVNCNRCVHVQSPHESKGGYEIPRVPSLRSKLNTLG